MDIQDDSSDESSAVEPTIQMISSTSYLNTICQV